MRYDSDHHTPSDEAALLAAGIDPTSTQPRTGYVPCDVCRRPTLNLGRGCDAHWVIPARAVPAPG